MGVRHISMGKVPRIKDVLRDLSRLNNVPSTLTVVGTEKWHGTNAAVCYSREDGIWFQSRNRVITVDEDNAGCAKEMHKRLPYFKSIINSLIEEYLPSNTKSTISLYMEYAGGNIQQKSCVSGLSKRFAIFSYFKVTPSEGEAKWLPTTFKCAPVSANDVDIYNVRDFKSVQLQLPVASPNEAIERMEEFALDVEKASNVGKHFGKPDNVGEGYVWTAEHWGEAYFWKTKGEVHNSGLKKVPKLVDTDALLKVSTFLEHQGCTPGRLNQMYMRIVNGTHNGDEQLVSLSDLGNFIKSVSLDIKEEEVNSLIEYNLTFKQISKYIGKLAVPYFKERVNV